MIHNWLYVCDSDLHVRYALGELGDNPLICIGLNPSTAIPGYLDRTLERVSAITKNLDKYDGWIMLNIYPYRGSNPDKLPKTKIDEDLIKDNIQVVKKILKQYDKSDILCAWGSIIKKQDYIVEIFKNDFLDILFENKERLKCIKLIDNKKHPCHPLKGSTDKPLKNFDISTYANLGIFQK